MKFNKTKLKELRLEKKMTQKDLGGLIDRDSKTISSYENGWAIPPLLVAFKLAEVLGVDINKFKETK